MSVIRALLVTVFAHRVLIARPRPRQLRPEPTVVVHRRNSAGGVVNDCEEIARALRAGHSPTEAINASIRLPVSSTTAGGLVSAISTESDGDRRLLLTVLAAILEGGGNGAEALDRCAARLRVRADDRREQRTAAAPARLSALILTVLPFGVLLLLISTSAGVRHHLAGRTGIAGLLLGLGLNLLGWRWMQRSITKPVGGRELEALAALADVLESTTLLVRAGVAPRRALLASARHATRPVEAHLTELGWRLEHGWLLADALVGLAERVGPSARRLIDGLVRAERYGSPLGQVLDRMVDDIDALRRDIAVRRTRTLPVRLSAPLVLCTLPSFVLLALLPAVGAALAGLNSGPLGNI